MGDAAVALLGRLEAAPSWPPPDVAAAWNDKARWVAHREADRDALAVLIGHDAAQGRYRVDPLPVRISEAFANLTFGRTPTVTAAAEADADNLAAIVAASDLGASLQRAEVTRSSEGEVWWRVVLDRASQPRPVVQWHSRLGVIPAFAAGRLTACAFVSRYDAAGIVYRHMEVHDATEIANVLYAGANDQLGGRVALATIPQTDRLLEEVRHGLPGVPAGWIPNRVGTDPTRGTSDYAAIEDYLLDLNEALQTAHANAQLTARRRMIVPQSALDEQGRLRKDDVIVAEQLDAAMADSPTPGNAFRVLEYSFDADALITYQDALARGALTRVGLVPQFVGLPSGPEGTALSGTALRVRLIPAVNAAEGKAAYWDAALPHVLGLLQLVDAAPWDGEPGTGWADPASPPKVDRGATLPTDPQEEADRIGALRAAKVISLEESVREVHPSWPAAQVDAELERLASEQAAPPIFGTVPGA